MRERRGRRLGPGIAAAARTSSSSGGGDRLPAASSSPRQIVFGNGPFVRGIAFLHVRETAIAIRHGESLAARSVTPDFFFSLPANPGRTAGVDENGGGNDRSIDPCSLPHDETPVSGSEAFLFFFLTRFAYAAYVACADNSNARYPLL